ncbi:MAG: ABC transporter permease [Anaerolineae bacterium]
MGRYLLKREKREVLKPREAAVISVLAILFALALFSVIFLLAGVNPLTAYREIFSYAFFNPFGLPLTINRFVFLLFATYAFLTPYHAGLWNIGMSGQLYLGALAAFGVLHVLDKMDVGNASVFVVLLLMLGAAVLGGAVMGAIAGFLRGKYNVNEIVVTMMMNFMAFWLVSFMIKEGGPFMNPGGRGESFELPDAFRAPLIGGIPFTIIIALILGLLLHFMFNYTRLGYEIRAYGANPAAAEYAGISKVRIPVLVFVIGGMLAGLAGYHYFGAVPGVYKIARNYGFFGDLAFYGIICGLISQGNHLALMPVAMLFGGLSIGGRFVQGKLGMSFGVDYALLGILMITLVGFQFFYRYQFRLLNTGKETIDVGILS